VRRLVVSIINYRTAELTLKCVASARAGLGDLDAEIVVVDNHSQDGSAERIADWIAARPAGPPVTLVRSARNTGFSGGHNQGMAARPAEFYFLLNSDALVRPGAASALLAEAAARPEAGLFAPRLEGEDGTQQINCFRFHSPMSELIRGAGSGPVTRLLAGHEVPLAMPPAAEQIGWASFAAILLRGSMVAELGPMDEGYFLYFEDAEYCLRARRAGWRVVHVPQARVVHFRGGSGPVKRLASEAARLPRYYYASRTRFLRQAHGPLGPLAGNLCWLAGRGVAHLRRLAGREVPRSNRAEWRDIWTGVRDPLAATPAAGA
jgi:N-acetylglucosaminyl-diphospho-decaprenol L-rhamnosyltransferase